MWPFKRTPLLDPDTSRWHVDNTVWLIRNLANTPTFSTSKLVLPSPGFFVTDEREGHRYAEAIFTQIKAYAGMSEWPVQLVSDVEVYEPNSDLIQATSRHTPLGMFFHDHSEGVRISYAPKLLKQPVNLIATLAHELAHYLIHSIEDTLPCSPDEMEFLTDQTACFMGFGVFMANSAFSFEQWRDVGVGTQGWRSQKSGYLPEADLIFDLALFLTAKSIEPDAVLACLKPHLTDMLKKAMRDVVEYAGELEAARASAYVY